jgi:hypothetical protein
MILGKNVAGLAAVAILMAAWPAWSTAQETTRSDAQDERAMLEARLKKIEATLEYILNREGDRRPRAGGAASAELGRGEGVILDAGDRRYEIVSENGRCALEAVELSSGELLWKTDVGTGLKSGVWRLSWTEDGKFLRAEVVSEDSSVAFTIDAETGRTTKQVISTSSHPRVTIAGPRRVPLGAATASRLMPAYYGAPPLRSPRPPTPAAASPQAELLTLATSYVDAIGDLNLARSKYEQLKALRGSAAASGELEAAAIHVQTAQQKVTLLAAVAEAAGDAALVELEAAERMYASGLIPASQVVALRTKVKTLASILQQRSSTAAPSNGAASSSFGLRK